MEDFLRRKTIAIASQQQRACVRMMAKDEPLLAAHPWLGWALLCPHGCVSAFWNIAFTPWSACKSAKSD
jgi:hypothetical protein